MPIDNLSKITSRSGINTTILLEAGNANVTGIVTAAGFDGPFTGGSGSDINAGIVTARDGLHVGVGGTIIHALSEDDGLVGIGTTNPQKKLEVFDGDIYLNSTDKKIFLSNDYDQYITANAASNYVVLGAGNKERVRIRSDNYIGIGTDQISKYVTIKAVHPSVRLEAADTSDKRLDLQVSSTGIATISAEQSSQQLSFKTTGGEALRINSSGDVGIGEATPDSKLDILHSSSTNPATENLIHLRTDPGAGYVSRGLFIKIGRDLNYDNSAAYYDIVGSAGNSGFHAFQVQGDDKLRITKDGKVGIGTTTPSAILEITKNAYNTPDNEDFFRIKLQNRGGVTNDVGIGQIATGNLAFNTTAGANFTFYNGTIGEVFRIEASGAGGGGVGISTAGGVISPDHNALLIRARSTVGTDKGHIMLTGDGATNNEGPQIVFSESGSGSNFVGGAIGFRRTGGNGVGDLVFGVRTVSGVATTPPTELVRITSSKQVGIGITNPNSTWKTHIRSSTFGLLRLETTLTGSDAPYLELYHNSSSPADDDELGVIQFKGKNDASQDHTYAYMMAKSTDVSDGSEDGDILFATAGGGGATERLRITSDGLVKWDGHTLAERNAATGVAGGLIYNSEGKIFQYYDGSGWISLNTTNQIVATGGNSVATSNGYRIHTFTGGGTFVITSGVGEVEVLVVAGGGSEGGANSGCHAGGGGGGGGVVYKKMNLSAGNYPISIGQGGTWRSNGGNTIFGNGTDDMITAVGGGAGGPTLTGNGNDGGSGGGSSRHTTTNVGGNAQQPGTTDGGFGNAGGDTGDNTSPGGGGGAGGPGLDGDAGNQGRGGAGKQFTQFGVTTYFGAGGNAGGSYTDEGQTATSTNGAANTGAGGGGSAGGATRTSGGSGIVLIRYPAAS